MCLHNHHSHVNKALDESRVVMAHIRLQAATERGCDVSRAGGNKEGKSSLGKKNDRFGAEEAVKVLAV